MILSCWFLQYLALHLCTCSQLKQCRASMIDEGLSGRRIFRTQCGLEKPSMAATRCDATNKRSLCRSSKHWQVAAKALWNPNSASRSVSWMQAWSMAMDRVDWFGWRCIYIYILIILLRLCVSDALWVTTASLSLLCDITRCYYKMKCGEAWCSLSCVIFAHLEREWRTSSEAFSRRKCRNHFGAGWTSSVGTATTLQAPASSFWSWSLDALAVCPLSPTVGIMNDEEWRRSCKLPACS